MAKTLAEIQEERFPLKETSCLTHFVKLTFQPTDELHQQVASAAED